MTREQIDTLDAEFALRSDATALKVHLACAAARRALELEEALKHGDIYIRQVFLDGTYGVTFTTPDCRSAYAEGATPLEAIQNARRGHGG